MIKTGIKVSHEDFLKIKALAELGWKKGDQLKGFTNEEITLKYKAMATAIHACHQLALDYGLPDINGYYGITHGGEFVKQE